MMETEVESEAQSYVCQQCGYIYNPSKGDKRGKVPPGTPFDDLHEEWNCPLCGARRSRFSPMV